MSEPTEEQMRAACGYTTLPQIAQFYDGALRDSKASEREGHNVYVSAPYVTIKAQGERDSISLPATREHQMQFREAWERFQASKAASAPSPIAALPTITRAVIRTLNELGVYSVEQLAAAPILDRVQIDEDQPEMDHMSSDAHIELSDRKLPCAVPSYLAKWQGIAKHFLTLKEYAQTGHKPRIKLEAAA